MADSHDQFGPQAIVLAGFIKGTTSHCYAQNIKALGYVVSWKIFLYFFPTVSVLGLITPGWGHV